MRKQLRMVERMSSGTYAARMVIMLGQKMPTMICTHARMHARTRDVATAAWQGARALWASRGGV